MKQKLGFLCAVLLLSCLLAAPSFAEDAEEEEQGVPSTLLMHLVRS